MTAKINLNEKFGLFTEHWRPKVIAAVNSHEIKIVKVKGASSLGIVTMMKTNSP